MPPGSSILILYSMLFQFHKQQNSKKPGSAHAIYLLSGFQNPKVSAPPSPKVAADGEDTYMQSSPFMSSSLQQKDNDEEPYAVRSVVMCREEDLESKGSLSLLVS